MYGPIEYELFLNRTIRPLDGTLAGTTTPGQSMTGSNSNKMVHRSTELESQYHTVFTFILKTTFLGEEILILCWEYSMCIPSLTKRAKNF